MKDYSSLIQKIENYSLIAGAVLTAFIFGERICANHKNEANKPPISIEQKVTEAKPNLELETKDDDTVLLAKLIYGEARGESYATKVAIAQTVLNRVKENECLQEVILKPKQFSCFNPNDPNFEKLQDPLKYEKPEVWQECYNVAEKVLNKEVEDISKGANHYCTNNPFWAKNKQPLFKKGKTKFYKLE